VINNGQGRHRQRSSPDTAPASLAHKTLRPRSIASKDRDKPSWLLKFSRTTSPIDRMMRRKTTGPQHLWATILIAHEHLERETCADHTCAARHDAGSSSRPPRTLYCCRAR